MRRILPTLVLAIAANAYAGLGPVSAAPSQGLDDPWQICIRETARVERAEGIPKDLLRAISLIESGRWDSRKQVNVAWPWTVTAEGKGRYFATKRDAITAVLELWSENVTNIDVGCLQVNLHYHGGAFANLEEAFEPSRNVAYGAKYLKSMYHASRSWSQAAGYYHSTRPERGLPYKAKVLKLWTRQPRNRLPAAIDRARTAAFNARWKAGRAAGLVAGAGTKRLDQMAAWRQGRPLAVTHLAAMQRARMAALRKRELMKSGEGEAEFAARRLAKLKAYRLPSRAGAY